MTIGGSGQARRPVLALAAGALVVLLALAWSGSGGSPSGPPPPTTTPVGGVAQAAEPVPALAGHRLLVHSRSSWVADLGTGEIEPIDVERGMRPPGRMAFSPDGGHLAFVRASEGDGGVPLRRIVVADLATGEVTDGCPIFHEVFVVLDGGTLVVSPLPQGVVVCDVTTGELTPLTYYVPVEDIEPHG